VQNDDCYQSPWLVSCQGTETEFLFRFNANAIFLFISGTPCGDASLDLLAEDPDNATPWTRPQGTITPSSLRGHEYIWERGKVRFKPGKLSSRCFYLQFWCRSCRFAPNVFEIMLRQIGFEVMYIAVKCLPREHHRSVVLLPRRLDCSSTCLSRIWISSRVF
jgi:hypothetical protein